MGDGNPQYTIHGGYKLVWPLKTNVWVFLRKLELDVPCDPDSQLLGYTQGTLFTAAETLVHQCSVNTLGGKGQCGTYTQWNVVQL